MNNAWVPSFRHRLGNAIGFQAGWFACVLGAAQGLTWLGPALVAVLAALHLRLVPNPRGELLLMGALAAVGTTLDATLAGIGLLAFPPFSLWFVPPWLTALWVNFALTLNASMRWLHVSRLLAVLLGLVGGPLAYLAGHRLGVLEFPLGARPALAALALVWGTCMPAFLILARRCRNTGLYRLP